MNIRYIAISAFAALLLAACGGGGGTSESTPQPEIMATDITGPNLGKIERTARNVGSSRPRFGSVTQSSNRDNAGTTTDVARARFDGDDMTVTIKRANASNVTISTTMDATATGAIDSIIDGHTLQAWTTFKHTDTSATASRLITSWSNTDSTDYLAGGYWIHMSGSIDPLNIRRFDVGAFVDGPELSGSPNMPIQGQARYAGPTAGLFAERIGSGFPGSAPPGSVKIGEFISFINLTADFSNRTISGCVGCITPIVASGYYTDGATGTIYEFTRDTLYYQVYLDSASFNSNGQFHNENIRIVSTAPNFPDIQSTGAWGGRFSNKADSMGEPRLVAGTLGGYGTTPDRSEGTFVGAWFAVK